MPRGHKNRHKYAEDLLNQLRIEQTLATFVRKRARNTPYRSILSHQVIVGATICNVCRYSFFSSRHLKCLSLLLLFQPHLKPKGTFWKRPWVSSSFSVTPPPHLAWFSSGRALWRGLNFCRIATLILSYHPIRYHFYSIHTGCRFTWFAMIYVEQMWKSHQVGFTYFLMLSLKTL